MSELPEGWADARLNLLFQQIPTSTKKILTKDCLPEGQFPVIDQGQPLIAGYYDDRNRSIQVDSPVVVFGDHTRVVKWISFDFVPGADGTKVLSPVQPIQPRYFYYLLRNLDLPDRGYGRHFQFVNEAEVAISPLAEQKVIADKLDALLAQVDTLQARLDAIPAILKRFRQSVLSAAVTGKLTEEWSSLQTGGKEYLDYPSALPPDIPATIPSDWKWVTVGDLASKVADGVHQKPSYVPAGVPFLTVKNLTAGKGIDFGQTNFISETDHSEFCKRTLPERDDILITKDGTLGVVRRIDTDAVFSIFVSLALVKPRDRRLSKYLEIAFSSIQVQSQMIGVGTGLQHIHLRDLRQDVIPLPSIEEQTEIVRRVESLFAFADQIEARTQEATARVKHLTQSILAKAFRGELTEEWRKAHPELVCGENSAAALLERIRAVRSEAPEAKGKRGRQAQHSPSEARLDGEDFSPSPNAPKKRGRPRKG